MIAIFITILAAGFASLTNFFLRKNLDITGTSKGFFLAMYAFSLVAGLVASPGILHEPLSMGMFLTGSVTGVLNVGLMGITAMAMASGPTGLSFAFQNSGSIFPAIFLFLVFGSDFGFTITPGMIVGLTLVLGGLFWGASKQQADGKGLNKKWFICACSIFLIQILALTLMQWRCLTFLEVPDHPFIPFSCTESQDVWFMPGMFITAFLLQVGLTFGQGHRPNKTELLYGAIGGITNGITTYLLLLGTALATPLEKGILFPTFAIGVIMICNVWSYFLYSEKVNWWANLLCSSGILIASI